MSNILFVCTGNTCRSPMAEAIFRSKLTEEEKERINCSSRGIAVFSGDLVSENAVAVMGEKNMDISLHMPRQLTPDDIENSDLIFCMTELHRDRLVSLFPDSGKKIRSLKPNILDPYGQDISVYRECRDQMAKSLNRLIFLLRRFEII